MPCLEKAHTFHLDYKYIIRELDHKNKLDIVISKPNICRMA